jgi:hypothetical protein
MTVAGGKISTDISDDLHLSAGSEVFIFPFNAEIVANINFAGFTYGNLDQHISISSGYITMPVFDTEAIPIVLSGHIRTSDRFAFVTENWLLLDIDSSGGTSYIDRRPFIAINSLAIRIIGKRDSNQWWNGPIFGLSSQIKSRFFTESGYPRITYDYGFIFVYGTESGSPFKFGPIPWLDWTWHFGPARK